MSPCPTSKRLVLFRNGQLPQAERQAIEKHVNDCPWCQALLPRAAPVTGAAGSRAGLAAGEPEVGSGLQHHTRIVGLLQEDPPPEGPPGPSPVAATAHSLAPPGFEILEEVGRGGTAVVFKALQLKLDGVVAADRVVALKMILEGDHARFRTETGAVARLQHPNIVPIFELGEHDGKAYFAMEFCPGGTLAEHLHDAALAPREAAELVEVLAQAVHVAHGQNVVHRNLKPSNILFGSEGGQTSLETTHVSPLSTRQPKIADFGLAKPLDGAGQPPGGAVPGTLGYLAPEQASGDAEAVGPAADVYGLGAILYECLTGRPPFRGADAAVTLRQVIADDPTPPRRLEPRVPRDLETICLKCLRKEPGRRYGSAQELADDLRRFLEGRPIVGRPMPRRERLWKWAKRRPLLAGGLAAAVLLLLASLAGGVWYWDARLRTKVEYYTTWTKRWGVPEGVGPLKPDDVGRRSQSWKITRRGGKVFKVEAVNGLGYPVWEDIPTAVGRVGSRRPSRRTCSFELSYDQDGRVVKEVGRDPTGRVLWTMHYVMPTTAFFTDAGGYLRPGPGSDAAYVDIVFDANGLEEEHRYRNKRGRPQPTANGVYGCRYRYNKQGVLVEATYLDAKGRPKLDRDGIASVRIGPDGQGNALEGGYFGADGKPILNPEGFARFEARYDKDGNRVEEAYFGVDNKPALCEDGFAKVQLWYDNRGNCVDMTYFGRDGRPVLDRNGVHKISARHDDRGLLVEGAFFGTDGKPVLNKDGYARFTKTYDGRGNEVQECYFDTLGSPTANRDGWAAVISQYDERGNRVETAAFDTHGRPTTIRSGVGKVKRFFDRRGNPIVEAYFDTEGRPTLDGNGIHKKRMVYDEFGNRTEVTYFAADGKATLSKDGVLQVKRSFDESGNEVQQSFFGTNAKLARHRRLGYARVVKRRDPASEDWIDATYYDEAGKVVPTRVVVQEVLPGSRARRAGLRAGDVVLSYDGKPFRNTPQLLFAIANRNATGRPGPIPVRVRRGDKQLDFSLPPGRVGAEFEDVATPE